MITKSQKDNLFSLIKSLNKSEKRQFKLYVGRLGVNTDSKFLKLFNLLDKAKVYDEASIIKTGIVKKQHREPLSTLERAGGTPVLRERVELPS